MRGIASAVRRRRPASRHGSGPRCSNVPIFLCRLRRTPSGTAPPCGVLCRGAGWRLAVSAVRHCRRRLSLSCAKSSSAGDLLSSGFCHRRTVPSPSRSGAGQAATGSRVARSERCRKRRIHRGCEHFVNSLRGRHSRRRRCAQATTTVRASGLPSAGRQK